MCVLSASTSSPSERPAARFTTTVVSKGRSELLCVSVAELKVAHRGVRCSDQLSLWRRDGHGRYEWDKWDIPLGKYLIYGIIVDDNGIMHNLWDNNG